MRQPGRVRRVECQAALNIYGVKFRYPLAARNCDELLDLALDNSTPRNDTSASNQRERPSYRLF